MQEIKSMKQKQGLFLATALTLVMTAGAANAGFQWVPKPKAEAPVAAAPVVAEPAPAAVVAPVAPAAVPAAEAAASEDLPPWIVQNSPALPADASATEVAGAEQAKFAPAPVADESEPVLEGFGKNMPLVIALRQIIPADRQFAFGSGVNMGATITWQGGKPWKEVLAGVLFPLGLSMRMQDNVVYIEKDASIPQQEGVFAAAVKAKAAEQPEMIEAPLMDEPVEVVTPVVEMPVTAVVDQAVDETPREMPAKQWVIEPGRTLREVMEDWGRQAGWVVVWRSERDYLIESGASFGGNFENAAEEVLKAFSNAEPPVKATFYLNRTLVIDAEAMSDLN